MNYLFRSATTAAALTWMVSISAAASLSDQLDELLKSWDRSDAPGIAVAVVRDGDVVYRRGFGLANLEHDVPIRPDSVFYLASVSKQFAAAATLIAAEEGKLSLDDSVRKYITELPDYAQPITIRHLINHTSGLRDYLWIMAWAGIPLENVYSEDELVTLIARQKRLNFAPGDDYSYSNSGYFLLSQAIKRATQRSLRQYAEDKIFKPLKMTHTHFHDDPWQVV
jgi:CubicO group peptidase (beta-lactamase class C family)